MGAGGFHGRVRDGIGCGHPAMATRSSKPRLRDAIALPHARVAGSGECVCEKAVLIPHWDDFYAR